MKLSDEIKVEHLDEEIVETEEVIEEHFENIHVEYIENVS